MGQNASKTSKDAALEQAHSWLNEILVTAQKGKFSQALLLIEEGLAPMRAALDEPNSLEGAKPLLICALMFKGWILEQTRHVIEARACYREAAQLGDAAAKLKLEKSSQTSLLISSPYPQSHVYVTTASSTNSSQVEASHHPTLYGATSDNAINSHTTIMTTLIHQDNQYPVASFYASSSQSTNSASISSHATINNPQTLENILAEFALLQSVTAKLALIRERVLSDPEQNADLAIYIPLRGAKFIQDSSTFDLDMRIEQFKNDPHLVMLLMGDSGSGKSLFIRFLEKKMWGEYKPGGFVPIVVLLSHLSKPEGDMMNESLAERGFDKNEIAYLQKHHSFFMMLDSYDEMNRWINLYSLNRLNEWQMKILIAMRYQALAARNDYQRCFAPVQNETILSNLLAEVTVMPFSDEQINAYIAKYLQLHPNSTWSSVESYQEQIRNLPGMRELVEIPLLLMFAMDVMPRIVEKFSDLRERGQIRVLRFDLYKHFIEKWFEQEQQKFIEQGDCPADGHDMIDDFWEFAQTLAAKMFTNRIYLVTYPPKSTSSQVTTSATNDNMWEDFFNTSEPDLNRARKACPLRKVGLDRYEFLYRSLIDFLVSYCRSCATLLEDDSELDTIAPGAHGHRK